MNLKEARENYYFHTGKVSDIVRQLALAAIAIVWLFKVGEASAPSVPSALILPLKLVVAGLSLDLLQYAFAAATWGLYQWIKDRADTPETQELRPPGAINWLALACFWSKICMIAWAYWLLIDYLRAAIKVLPT